MDHRLYLLFAIVTHGLVGYALVRALTSAPPVVGVLGAVAPDLDLLFAPGWQFPFVHRGITHTPALVGLVLLTVLLVSSSSGPAVVAFGLGALSHLIVDTFTRSGVMWLYPASAQAVAVDLSIHGAAGTLLLWSVAVGLLGLDQFEPWGKPTE